MYLINKQDIPAIIYNLGIILSSDSVFEENDGDIFLPTEQDVLDALEVHSISGESTDEITYTENNNS